jgi:hypothetical protein
MKELLKNVLEFIGCWIFSVIVLFLIFYISVVNVKCCVKQQPEWISIYNAQTRAFESKYIEVCYQYGKISPRITCEPN